MSNWEREHLPLPDDHHWKVRDGYKLFIADRGALRFAIPSDWIVTRGSDSIRFTDREPPDDDCLLQASLIHLPPGIDWTGLPLMKLLDDMITTDSRKLTPRRQMVFEHRRDVELAWIESSFIDPIGKREARDRACFARGFDLQAFITMDYWPEDRQRFIPIWDEVLRSLRLGEYVEDISGRPAPRQR